MFPIQEQFSAAIKGNFDTQLAMTIALANKALESAQNFAKLNMNLAKSSLEESSGAIKQIMSAQDSQEVLSLCATHAQPNVESMLTYARQVASMVSSYHAEFATALEAHVTEMNHKVTKAIDDVARNAPAGSEHAIALVKSAVGNANARYGQFTKTAHQAAGAIEANMNMAAAQIMPTKKSGARNSA